MATNVDKIDWEALSFTCTHQADLWPQFDPEADAWYKQARAAHKKQIDANDLIIQLYQQAADKDHIKAIAMLGWVYQQGDGVPKDEAKAVAIAERLMEMNVGIGYYQLAAYLESGIGVEMDKTAALAYARKAADLGNPHGQFTIGKILIHKQFGEPEHPKFFAIGKQMLECALAQDYSEAGHALGLYYSDEDTPKSLKYYQKAAALGNGKSLFSLEMNFEEGRYGLKKDPARAACYKQLGDEVDADKYKKFPNLDTICPLPPKPMPSR